MAKQVLPVNFQDDVLSSGMNGKRRYMLIQQDDGSYILNDVTNYTTVGSTFGAAQINQTNQAVNDSADKDDILDTMEEINANTDSGKMAGALAVKELSSELPQIQQGRLRLKFDGTGYLSNSDNLNFFPFSFKDTNYSIVFTITAVSNDTVRTHGTCFFVEDKTINGAKLNIYNKDQNYTSSDWADVDWIAIRNS